MQPHMKHLFLEPATHAFVQAGASNPPLNSLSISEARAALEGLQNSSNPPLGDVSEEILQLPVGPTGSVTVHLYKPKSASEKQLPVIAYFHGGGWILGSPKTHLRLVLDLIAETGAAVFFVYYTPSPEAIFPVPIEQSYEAIQWLHANASTHNLDSSRIAFAGDSAGGAMSAGVTLLAVQRHTPLPLYQVLFYPVTDITRESATYTEFEDGPGLTAHLLRWMVGAFAPVVAARIEPTASPLLARDEDLERFPPTAVITAETDPLRHEGEEFAQKLSRNGVETTVVRALSTVHDFVMLNALSKTPAARMAIELAGVKLRAAFAK